MALRMCKVCGKWHDLEESWPCALKLPRKSAAPQVISDNMEPLKHHGTGRIISSKREFSRETRAAGMVELGNEPIKPRPVIKLDRGQRREEIKKTIYQLKNGYIDKSGN